MQENNKTIKEVLPWPYSQALVELDQIGPKVKANRLAVDKKTVSLGRPLSRQEMNLICRTLDLLPDDVDVLAKEYDQLVRTREYEKLYGEYWPGKKLPPVLIIDI